MRQIWQLQEAKNKFSQLVEKAQQEVEDLRADVTTLEAEYMQSSMQSEVAKRAAQLDIYELNQPPIKIEVSK